MRSRTVPLTLAVFLAGVWALVSIPVAGHEGVLRPCWRTTTLLGERVNPNGTVSEAYDSNEDGKIDIEAISSLDGVGSQHTALPFLYIMDMDYDGTPDAAWVDVLGTGECAGWVFYGPLGAHTPLPPLAMIGRRF